MKNSLTLGAILLVCVGFAQPQESAAKLSQLLHSDDIEFKLQFIRDFPLSTAKDSTENKKSKEKAIANLYADLTKVYTQLYTETELKSLLNFYNSPTGKKLLKNQNQQAQKTAEVLFNWEMKQQGMVMESPNPEEALADIAEIAPEISPHSTSTVEELQKKVVPKIKTLEDLKAIVKENPFMITDQDLLKELLGKEAFDKLHNPPILDVEEPKMETLSKENRTSKKQ